MAAQFRDYDRNLHAGSYPHLYYPHVFILDGGYRDFYRQYPLLCDGQYTTMLDEIHRKNGDLARCNTDYQRVTTAFDRFLNPTTSKADQKRLMSPDRQHCRGSPVSKFMLCFTNPNVIDKHPRLTDRIRPCAEFF
jgi:hypothetical protein